MRNRLRTWLQLVRLPNLFTVPGDPIAGFLLAGTGFEAGLVAPLACAALASVLFYAFGLITNDFFDLAKDRHERPDRPFASGRISPAAGLAMAVLMAFCGLGLSWLIGPAPGLVSVLLVISILAYNGFSKKMPAAGPLNMGLCRGLSFFLGVTARPGFTADLPVIAAGIGLTLYVAAVTSVAVGEMTRKRVGIARWAPFAVLLVCFAVFYYVSAKGGVHRAGAIALSCTLATVALLRAWVLGDVLGPRFNVKIPKVVGNLVQTILVVQAAFVVMHGRNALVPAAVLIMLVPFFTSVSERYYSS